MTAPKPNITLADGSQCYLPPRARTVMRQLALPGSLGIECSSNVGLRRLVGLGLVDSVQPKGSKKQLWYLTDQGQKVAKQLAKYGGCKQEAPSQLRG